MLFCQNTTLHATNVQTDGAVIVICICSFVFVSYYICTELFLCMYRAFCTVYYPDQQTHNIYLLIMFYIL